MKLTNTRPVIWRSSADSEIHSRRIRAWIKVDIDGRREAPSVIKRNENDRVSGRVIYGKAANREEIPKEKLKSQRGLLLSGLWQFKKKKRRKKEEEEETKLRGVRGRTEALSCVAFAVPTFATLRETFQQVVILPR